MPTSWVALAPSAASLPTENPPGPEDPADIPDATYYMATTGSDAAAGTLAAPFLTLSKFLAVAVPGDVLYVRGGTYTGTSNRNLSITSLTGTVNNPISIIAYPAETPIFNGQANGTTDRDRYWINANGACNYFTIDGITLTNMSMYQDGVITLSNQSGGTIRGWILRNMDIQQVAHSSPNPDPSSQWVYLGEGYVDLEVDSCIFRGPYPGSTVIAGAGVSAYSDAGAAPTGINVHDSQFIGTFTGVQFYSTGVTGVIDSNTFTDCQTNIDLTHHSTVTVTDNTGEHGTAADIYDPNNSSATTSSGNVFT